MKAEPTKAPDPYGTGAVLAILMRRDGMTLSEAIEHVAYCRTCVEDGDSPEGVCRRELRLEPDYVWVLM